MGSKRRSKGSTRFVDGRWYAVLTLADRTRKEERIPVAPGEPFDGDDAAEYARQMQRRVDAGWDPRTSTATTEPTTVLAYVEAHLSTQTYESAPKDRALVERWLTRSPIAHIKLADLRA